MSTSKNHCNICVQVNLFDSHWSNFHNISLIIHIILFPLWVISCKLQNSPLTPVFMREKIDGRLIYALTVAKNCFVLNQFPLKSLSFLKLMYYTIANSTMCIFKSQDNDMICHYVGVDTQFKGFLSEASFMVSLCCEMAS